MVVNESPSASLGTIPRADGSATFSHGGYTIMASVNGPMEASRRDELPNKAYVDVIVRPAAGAGGPRERYFEQLLQSAFSHLILVRRFPRSVVQIVLQVKSSPQNAYTNPRLSQSSINVAMIPALFHAAELALLSSGMPMWTIATACTVAYVPESDSASKLVSNPSATQLAASSSKHTLALTPKGKLLLVESEGVFSLREWDEAHNVAMKICCRPQPKLDFGISLGTDMALDDDNHESAELDMQRFLRLTIESQVQKDLYVSKTS